VDKIAPILAWMRKNAFWLGCGLIALVMVGTFVLARMSIEKARKANETKINSLFTQVSAIRSGNAEDIESTELTVHPNQTSITGMEERIAQGEKSAIEAWEIRYNKQKELFKWIPEEVGGKGVAEIFSSFESAELAKFATINENVTYEGVRSQYRVELNKRIGKLAEIVNTTWSHASTDDPSGAKSDTDDTGNNDLAAPAGGGGAAGTGLDGDFNNMVVDASDDLVVWNQANQDLWQQKITQFSGVEGSRKDPSLYEIMLIQEDLWVLKSVLEIIASVNEGADARDLADIKQIDHILIGGEAWLEPEKTDVRLPNIKADQEEEKKETTKRDTGDDVGVGEVAQKSDRTKKKSATPIAGPRRPRDAFDPKAGDGDPSHGRYVSHNFERMSATEVTDAVNADKMTNLVHFSVAKGIPVRVALVMNEKNIGEFLAACANSELVFEVRQVRINRHTPGDGSLSASGGGAGMNRPSDGSGSSEMDRPEDGSGGESGAGASTGGDFEPAGGAGAGVDGDDGSGGRGADLSSSSVDTRTNYDVNVEFYGVIKIYNKVNYKMLHAAPKKVTPEDSGDDADKKTDEKGKEENGKARP